MPPDRRRLDQMARRRASVLTRSELLGVGAHTDWVSRQVTEGRWQRVFPGVYVTHTGAMTWRTQAVAALRYAGRSAALSHNSAAAFWFDEQRRVQDVVEISVPWERVVRKQSGIRIHRRRTMPEVHSGLVSATTDVETVLDLVRRAKKEDDVVGILTRAARRTWPDAVREAAERRPKLRHRELLLGLVAEVSQGVESPLEHRYHRDVERGHGLPPAELQVRELLDGGWVRADRRYRDFGVRVELDGRLAHPGGRTDRDTWRDNAALLATDEVTLRYRWSHVVATPCGTAAQVLVALRRGGWTGCPVPCGPECTLAAGAQPG